MCHLVFTQHHVYDIHIMALTMVVDVELGDSANLGPPWGGILYFYERHILAFGLRWEGPEFTLARWRVSL